MPQSVARPQHKSAAWRKEWGVAEDSFVGSLSESIGNLDEFPSDAEIMEILENVLDRALRAVNAKDGSLLVRDEETDELVFALVQGDASNKDLRWRRLPPGEGIASWVVRNGEAAVVNDTHTDKRFYEGLDKEFEFRTNSLLAAPIIGGGEVLGAIELLNKRDGQLFDDNDRERLASMCRFAGELLYSLIRRLDISEDD